MQTPTKLRNNPAFNLGAFVLAAIAVFALGLLAGQAVHGNDHAGKSMHRRSSNSMKNMKGM